jgi:cob(I)alamin adenosyltransferase
MDSYVTTRRGDLGETTALSGQSLPKGHIVVECTGCVDELRAQTALLRLQILERDPDSRHAPFLLWLLHTYFPIGSACSDPANQHPEYHPRRIGPPHLARLEAEQESLESALTMPRKFIASAATPLAALADVTCTAARRLERNLVRLREAEPAFDAEHILRFVNRLSDYLYILARTLDGDHHISVDYTMLDQE